MEKATSLITNKTTISRLKIQTIGLTQLLARYINEAFAKMYIQYPSAATAIYQQKANVIFEASHKIKQTNIKM